MRSNKSSRHPMFNLGNAPIPRSSAQAARMRHNHVGVITRSGNGSETVFCDVCLNYITREV